MLQSGSNLPPGRDQPFEILLFYSMSIFYCSKNKTQQFLEEIKAYIHNSTENYVDSVTSLFKLVQAPFN